MIHHDMVQTIGRALHKGAKHVSGGTWEWDVSGRCTSPVTVERTVRPPGKWRPRMERKPESDPLVAAVLAAFPGSEVTRDDRVSGRVQEAGYEKFVTVAPGTKISHTLRLETPCRKCEQCLKHRSRLWAARCVAETRDAARTWLGTLTFRPEEHYAALTRASLKLSKQGDDFAALTEGQQSSARIAAMSPWITLFLKRVRKQSGARVRYCLVWEQHKSGLPHAHLLLHEVDENSTIRKRLLQAQWPHGFSNFKLVADPRAAGYVAKYLSKSAIARVRASGLYGGFVYPPKTRSLIIPDDAEGGERGEDVRPHFDEPLAPSR